MLKLKHIHHIAILCSNYKKSKQFYTTILGLTIIKESYREDRGSYKLDLALNDCYVVELFYIPESPPRVDSPEALGLRHLAFAVDNIKESRAALIENGISTEAIRVDPLSGKQFVFFKDPDGLPIELYES